MLDIQNPRGEHRFDRVVFNESAMEVLRRPPLPQDAHHDYVGPVQEFHNFSFVDAVDLSRQWDDGLGQKIDAALPADAGAVQKIAYGRMIVGWERGRKLFERMKGDLASLLPKATGSVRRRERADQGDFLDIFRVYAGELDRAWQRTRRKPASRGGGSAPYAVVAVNTAIAACESVDVLVHGALAAATIVDFLETVGVRCEVVMLTPRQVYVQNGDGPDPVTLDVTRLKPFNSPMEAAHVVDMLAPTMARTLGFHASFARYANTRGGLGAPLQHLRAKDLEPALTEVPAYKDVLRIVVPRLANKGALVNWVADVLEGWK